MRLMRADTTTDPARTLYTRRPYYTAVVPYDAPADRRLRRLARSEYERDPMEPLAQAMLIHTTLVSGRPGYDYSNPYAWIGRLGISKPTLVPTYGGAVVMPQSVAANIAATDHLIAKRW